MEEVMQAIVCPECGETIPVNPDDVARFSRIVCEACLLTLEILEEDPIEVSVVEIDPDELDDDDYDEDEAE